MRPSESIGEDPIFTPLRFRNLTVKNRILRSSISGRWDNEDGSPTQTRLNWESKFARGGVGAIITSFDGLQDLPELIEAYLPLAAPRIEPLRGQTQGTGIDRAGADPADLLRTDQSGRFEHAQMLHRRRQRHRQRPRELAHRRRPAHQSLDHRAPRGIR